MSVFGVASPRRTPFLLLLALAVDFFGASFSPAAAASWDSRLLAGRFFLQWLGASGRRCGTSLGVDMLIRRFTVLLALAGSALACRSAVSRRHNKLIPLESLMHVVWFNLTGDRFALPRR